MRQLKGLVKKLVYRTAQTGSGEERPRGFRLYQFFLLLGRAWQQFRKDHCLVRASGLAFNSFITLVPFMTLILLVGSIFGLFDVFTVYFKQFFFSAFVPTKQEIIFQYINKFTENAAALGVVGLFFFVFVSVFLINNVVTNVNAVWGTHYSGKLINKFTTYTSVLFFVSLVIGVSLSFVTFLQPFVSRIGFRNTRVISDVLIISLPVIVVFLTMFLLFLFTPFTKVKGISALTGAVIGTILWEIGKRIFIFSVNSVIRMSLIYGSITVLPIFMIWLYIAWGIILFSLEITYVHQYGPGSWAGKPSLDMPPAEILAKGLDIFLYIAKAYRDKTRPPDKAMILRKFYSGGRGIGGIINALLINNLISRVRGKHKGFVPSRELNAIRLEELLWVLIGEDPGGPDRHRDNSSDNIIRAMSADGIKSFGAVTVAEVLSEKSLGEN